MTIVNNFPSSIYQGTKSILLAEVNVFGWKSCKNFGIAILALGCCSLISLIILTIFYKVKIFDKNFELYNTDIDKW